MNMPTEIKYQHCRLHPDSHFFDRESMRFFGDYMSNYGARKATVITHGSPEPVECWELYRKRPVKHGLQASAYFARDDFRQVMAKTAAPCTATA